MRLRIGHVTEYHYDQPLQFSLQRLRLTPRSHAGQTVVGWNVAVEGAHIEVEYDDQFGNHVNLVSSEGHQSVTRIVATGEVETEDRNGITGPHAGFCPLWLFRRETALTTAGKLVGDLARRLPQGADIERMHGLMEAIRKRVEYKPGATGTETTAEEALQHGAGVCQDHAHVFIAAARTLGLPSRYVSGYLMMPDQPQQSATHAWAEVHVDGLGWIGFDPANGICPDARYVRVATGLDYRDAAPVSGLRIGSGGGENLSVTISVENNGQMQAQSQ